MKSGSNQTMNISQILTKLKSIVYSKSEADTLLSHKASSSHNHTKSEITDFPTIPTQTSQLSNDSGFLTSHQSLDGRVAKAGDTMTGTLNLSTENNVCLNLRPSNANYYDTISVQTAGNEAVVFATKNSVTSWMFVNGEDSITNHTDSRWQSLTPGLQIKSNKVAIGKLIANGANLTYPLEVNGTVSASSVVVTNNSSNGVLFGSYRVYVG